MVKSGIQTQTSFLVILFLNTNDLCGVLMSGYWITEIHGKEILFDGGVLYVFVILEFCYHREFISLV